MWQWSNVDDFEYFDTSSMNRTHSRFTTITWTLNVYLNLAHT